MVKRAERRLWIGGALLLALAACGSSTSSGAPGPSSAGDGDDGAEPAPAVVGNEDPTGDTAVPVADRKLVLRHGPMTYVMDTPRNQLEKGGRAIEESGLVAALRSRNIEVTIEADPALSDAVILLADGEEIARTEMHDVDGKEVPADVLSAVDEHFGTAP